MKTKEKEKACKFFYLWVKKSLKYQAVLVPLFVVLFIFVQKIEAEEIIPIKKGDIVINELMWMGMGEDSGDEWIELRNMTNHKIDLTDVYIKNGGSGTKGIAIPAGKIIEANGYFIIAKRAEENSEARFLVDENTDLDWFQFSDVSLLDSGEELILSTRDGVEGENLDIVWKKAKWPAGENPTKDERESGRIKKSMERNEVIADGAVSSNWHTCIASLDMEKNCATPGAKNSEIEEVEDDEEVEPEPIIIPPVEESYSGDIIINEIFPAPLKNSGLEEFVELYSPSDKLQNLNDWYLKDRAGKICVLTGNIIDPTVSNFLVFKNNPEKNCTLALNDTQGETLELYNPADKDPIFSLGYESSAKKGRSYNFDGSVWRWSKFLTPGKENIFNNEPYGKIKIDEDVYVNVYADFEIGASDADGDSVKVTWDFGDGHKSYMAKTRHKYLEKGIYKGSVKLGDGSEDVIKNFTIEVKKFPHPKVRIVGISANPAGADTGVEFLTIENKDNKKINLNAWSIATGWKDFVNHPIREDVIIAKKKTKEITSEVSSFTLNNVKAKIQLRYPDGEVAHEVKYKTPNKTIAEGERYAKTKSGWVWQKNVQLMTDDKKLDANAIETVIDQTSLPSGHLSPSEERMITKKTFEENKLISASNDEIRIEMLKGTPSMTGAQAVREIDGIYFLTPEVPQKKHYAVVFVEKVLRSANVLMNEVLNKLL